jgi:Fur family ferric uptake transcriptional regulator
MSLAHLRAELKERSLKPDRSTLFRELIYLSKHAIAVKNTISGVDYYEIPHDHHHHLVCLGCNSIDKIDIGNHLEKQEKSIAKQSEFTVINHSLEFYGYCKDCNK